MGYSARRGFTNGKVSGAQRQAELQQKIAEVQEPPRRRLRPRSLLPVWAAAW